MMMMRNYGSPTIPPAHRGWGVDGRNGPAGGDWVYFHRAPLIGQGTVPEVIERSSLGNKVLPTIMRSNASDHPRTIPNGVAYPELSYFQRALSGR
jgi:hypothetical protein